MRARTFTVVLGLAAISQGATCYPPITPVAVYMPIAPQMRPVRSVTVSGVGGVGMGVVGPRFTSHSWLSGMMVGGAGRVAYQAHADVSVALSVGGVRLYENSVGDPPFRGAAHGTFEARFRVRERHSAFVGAGGGAQMWTQLGDYSGCAPQPCVAGDTPSATVLSPIASLHGGFGATWIQRRYVDWYSNFVLGLTYGNAFLVSPPAAAPVVQTRPDFTALLLVSTGVRVTLLRDNPSRVRWSLLIDAAFLGRTDPLLAGILTLGTSVEFDAAPSLADRYQDVRRLE